MRPVIQGMSKGIFLVLIFAFMTAAFVDRCLASGEVSSWAMRDGTGITLVREEGNSIVKDSQGNILLDFPAPLVVEQTVLSSDRSVLLMSIVSKPPSKGKKIREATWYSHLGLVYKNSEGQWKAKRVLSGNRAPMNELHRSISEIGAVSNSGSMAVLLVSESDRKELPASIRREWRTMKLDTGEVVAIGRDLPKGFDD